MAHRGGAYEAIENTLPAFRRAAAVGADFLELDVQETLDGHVVVYHDESLFRLTGIQLKVSQVAYKDLPLLLVPKRFAHCGTIEKEMLRIPLLSEVLDEFPTYPMQIDVKSGSMNLIRKTGKLIQERGDSFTLWGSFHFWANRRILQAYGNDIPRFMPHYKFLLTFLFYQIGFTHWLPITEKALIIRWGLLPHPKQYFAALQARGVNIIVFGPSLNSVEEFGKAIEMGVDSICTDSPSLLSTWLKSREQ